MTETPEAPGSVPRLMTKLSNVLCVYPKSLVIMTHYKILTIG